MDGIYNMFGATSGLGVYSAGNWENCPVEAVRRKAVAGAFYEEVFNTVPGGTIPTTEGAFRNGALFTSTGGTLTNDTTEVGGGWAMGSDGDNKGAGYRQGGAPFKLILTGGDFWAEWSMLTSTVTDAKHNIFSGFMEDTGITATVPITAAGALADKNLVGFHRPETARTVAGTGGAIMNAVYKCDGVTAVTVQTDAAALVAATYTNVGLRFVPRRNFGKGPGYLYWYQNGAIVASKLVPSAAGTDFPNDINLAFVFAVINATATTPGTSTVRYVRAVQLASPMP